MADTTEDLDAWRAAAIEQWSDGRIVDAAWLDVAIWFFQHSYADFVNLDCELIGFSLRQKHRDWLLVVKVLQGGTQRVGFVSSINPIRCMRKLRDMMRAGELRLMDDRFAGG